MPLGVLWATPGGLVCDQVLRCPPTARAAEAAGGRARTCGLLHGIWRLGHNDAYWNHDE